MLRKNSVLLLTGYLITGWIYADDAAPKMIVEPSATKVYLAKANLTVSTLQHEEQAYQGSYQLKVTPFTFKSETGTLSLTASDETVHKMAEGQSVEFTGKATNDKNGLVKVVKGKTTPADNNHGDVSFSVETENGVMLFNTSYHLVKQ